MTPAWRARLFHVLMGAATLFCLAGLAAASLENMSCGHEHLVGGHVFYHHHFYLGAHEHHPFRFEMHELSGAQPVPGRKTPVPSRRDSRETPRTTATISALPTLIQPVAASVLAPPQRISISGVLAFTLPQVMRPVALPSLPRGPPASPSQKESS